MKLDAGFTLIELLVVIFIITIITSVALLTISRNENRKLQAFTKEFVERLTLAEEQALLKPAVIGVSIKQDHYQFLNYEPATSEKKSSWQPTEDKLLNTYVIPDDIELTFESQFNDETPQIIISTNGDITPFIIRVGKKGKSPRYIIKGTADGNITGKPLL